MCFNRINYREVIRDACAVVDGGCPDLELKVPHAYDEIDEHCKYCNNDSGRPPSNHGTESAVLNVEP